MNHRTTSEAALLNGHPVTEAPLQGKEKIHRFEDGDETITVRVLESFRGEYCAAEVGEHLDGSAPVGYGDSELYAIADLFEKLPRARSEREERDHLAERWDHARDLRKHG